MRQDERVNRRDGAKGQMGRTRNGADRLDETRGVYG